MNYTDKIQKLIQTKEKYKYSLEGRKANFQTRAILIALSHDVKPKVLAQDLGISTSRIYEIKQSYKIKE
jgi:hypothetical protein